MYANRAKQVLLFPNISHERGRYNNDITRVAFIGTLDITEHYFQSHCIIKHKHFESVKKECFLHT